MNITDIFAATPAEIDTLIASTEQSIAALSNTVSRSNRLLAQGWFEDRASVEAQIVECTGKLRVLKALVTALNTEFERRGGWMRYWIVNNSNGHVHTTTHCPTTYDTTEFIWLTAFSGEAKEAVVSRAGELGCLTCFPEHREFIESGRPCYIETPERKAAREEREAQAAAKATKLAKNGITNPDGTPLMLPDDFGRMVEVKTEAAANRRVMEAAYDLVTYPKMTSIDRHNQLKTLDLGLAALAVKRGTTTEEQFEQLRTKIEKKYRKDYPGQECPRIR